MEHYTHNLKMIFTDDNDEIIDDTCAQLLLFNITETITQKHTHQLEIDGETMTVELRWTQEFIDKRMEHFMGNLFIRSPYSDDSILYYHLKKTLDLLFEKLPPGFSAHISRLSCCTKSISETWMM